MPEFQPAPARLPDGHRVYAVGDVHGCDERLARLHGLIAADLAARPVPRPLLLHLGDYVDKGPDSAGVVARLAAGPPLPGVPVVNLLGNHERTMLDALAGRAGRGHRLALQRRRAGARELAHRPGLADPFVVRRHPGRAPGVPRRAVAAPPGRRLPLRPCRLRPGVPLERQSLDDLLRIRGAFLHSDADFGAVVVHGHTPVRHGPEVRRNRVNLDTGAVFGRELTCGVFEGDRLGFLFA